MATRPATVGGVGPVPAIGLDDVMPWWAGAVSLGIVATIAAHTLAETAPAHRLAMGAALAVAVAPWLLGVIRHQLLPLWAYAVPVLGSLGMIHIVWVGARVVDHGGAGAGDQVSIFIGIWLVGQVSAVESTRAAIVTWLGMALVVAGRHLADPHFDAGVVWLAGCTVALVCGVFVRLLIRTVTELRAAQQVLAAEAARDERQRIAREVHDVVAHSMTVSMLHLTAARLAVNRGDSAAAVEALEEAERAGRSSMADIRTTMGLLRDDDDPSGTLDVPAPSTQDLGGLVGSWRAAGIDVELETAGDPAGLSPATGLVVYRVVQESLANAARHQLGSVSRVQVTLDPHGVVVTVASTGGEATGRPASGEGRGLIGMHERVEALGGSLDTGPTADGWRVVARLPRAVPADLVP